MIRQPNVVGDGTTGRCGEVSGETCAVGGERRRSQSLHGTEAAKAARSAESKAAPRDGRQEGGGVSFTTKQSESQAPAVPVRATQGAQTHGRDWWWVEASVWNERMLAALENGVKGGKWFSLIDKVYRAETLKAAWKKVKGNGGAAGVDGQSVERFAARAELEVVVAQSVKHIHRSGPLQELRWEPCFIQRLTERRGRLLSLTGQITPLPGARLACLNARQVYQPNGNKKRTDRMRKLTWLLPAQKSKRENLWRLCGSTDQHIARKDPPIPSSRWASRPC
jgi:hypothetical protein